MKHTRSSRPSLVLWSVLGAIILSLAVQAAASAPRPGAGAAPASVAQQSANFITRSNAQFSFNGQPVRFAGTNNYFLPHTDQATTADVLRVAASNQFVVIRTWGFLDVGSSNGANSVGDGPKNGVYFQYWNGSAPAINTGDNGLKRLDYVIHAASQAGVRLIIPFTNNWRDFGGMDQYVRWRGGQYHDQFYTDPVIRQWYKNYISTLLNRVNSYSGVRYKDDPTIMAWELANEPRCKGSGDYPTSSQCNVQTLTSWVAEMSKFVKSIDSRHLLAVGDEGFYCKPGASDWTENCSVGVDTLAYGRMETIDFLSLHLYTDQWGKSTDWGTSWITRHVADSRALGKPALLGEFGIRDDTQRDAVYNTWMQAIQDSGAGGGLFWMLAGTTGSSTPPPNSYRVYCPSTACQTLSKHAAKLNAPISAPTQPPATALPSATTQPVQTPQPATPQPPNPPAQTGMIAGISGIAEGQRVAGTLTIEAKVAQGVAVDRVVFELAGPTPAIHTERTGPYFFMGDSGGRAYGWDTRRFADGEYTLTTTVRDTAGRSEARQIRFRVANNATVAPTATPVRPTATAVAPTAAPQGPSVSGISGVREGQSLSGVATIQAQVTGAEITSVVFKLDGPLNAVHTERVGPYFFMGDNGGQAYGWDTRRAPNGSYTMTVTVTDRAGRSSSTKVSFRVSN
jgi:hypothetical protein